MKNPVVRDRVRVEGHDGIFRVVHVDERKEVADVASIDRVGFLEQVPLSKIHPVDDPGKHKTRVR